MRFRRVLAATALACAVLLSSDASAAPRPARFTRLEGVPVYREYLPGTYQSLGLCRLGQYGDPVGVIGDPTNGGTIFFNENDTYWTYMELRSDSCAGCINGYFGRLSMAHLTLFFPFAPETVTVNVSVVASVRIPCHYPNNIDANAVICAAFPVTFSCQIPNSVYDFALPIPLGCTITVPDAQPGQVPIGPAFLGFEFVTANDTTQLHKPQLVVQAVQKTCNSFNPVGFSYVDIVTEYGVGNPIMYAEISQCESVPVRRKSWGELKLLYR